MKSHYWVAILLVCLSLITVAAQANTPPIGKAAATVFMVDKHGSGDFTSIQAAINASSAAKEAIIFIKPGTYNEKLFITRNNISLIGSSASNTFVSYAELRNNWRENHDSDWGAAVINISASDVNIINLSVTNNYGRLHNTDDHQFAIRSFETATRIILHQCSVIADGADTLSLWNKDDGMYYHSYCHFAGHTDMVCPRGWALIENSTFFNHKKSATIWHDGELNADQKLVVANSQFDGIKDFWLGRHHYDAQFYLIDSQFSDNMANKPIFKKTYANLDKIRANLFGDRYFFFGNQSSQAYPWLADNFFPNKTYLKNQSLEQWVFNGKWQPNKVLAQLQGEITKAKFTADILQLKKGE